MNSGVYSKNKKIKNKKNKNKTGPANTWGSFHQVWVWPRPCNQALPPSHSKNHFTRQKYSSTEVKRRAAILGHLLTEEDGFGVWMVRSSHRPSQSLFSYRRFRPAPRLRSPLLPRSGFSLLALFTFSVYFFTLNAQSSILPFTSVSLVRSANRRNGET